MIQMKIIVRDEKGIKRCFAQVRDIDYLAKRCNSTKFRRLALGNAIFRDLKPETFVDIKNMGVAEIIEENPYIVDFSEFSKYDALTLSRIIVASRSFFPDDRRKMDEEHKTEDLVDLISLKNNMLVYPIPILYDEKQLVDDGEVVFGSTTLPGCYLLRSTNPEIDLIDYFEKNAQALFESINPEEKMASYEIIKTDNDVFVRFKVKRDIFAKIKKRIAG